MPESDPNSYAQDFIHTKHLHVDFCVNFDKKIFECSAVLYILIQQSTTEITLDTRQLSISSAKISVLAEQDKQQILGTDWYNKKMCLEKFREQKHTVECTCELGSEHAAFGSKLTVKSPMELKKGQIVVLKIEYQTSKTCSAVQWLDPVQTAGKKHPYLFTQCQAIHARSLVPCQDSPGLKFTYTATVKVSKPLTAVMSALTDGDSEDHGDYSVFKFKQPVPIPSYLLAMAVGKLSWRKIGPRSRVWSEDETVEAGEFEFAETEAFVEAAEKIVSPYVWHSYDILLLPPSFPYGGMENPCLTFVTPTLIAGDRSLVDVVAHEISHSWAGNLVTNRNWQHFWLNEGFCVYIERKIVGNLHGERTRQFKSIIGWNALKRSIETFGSENKLTNLVVDLNGVDPDDAFSSVPYEKGFNLLYHLECQVGSEAFDEYLKAHFEHFAYKSITTDDWNQYLYQFFCEKYPSKVEYLEKVDWDSWLHKPGMPPVTMPFDTTLADQCTKLAKRWESEAHSDLLQVFNPEEYFEFATDQKIVFLEELLELKEPLHETSLVYIWQQYQVEKSNNAEIRFRFFQVCLKSQVSFIIPFVVEFLKEQGRMKFLRPLYRSLMKFAEGKNVAWKTFEEQKSLYHPIASQMVAKDIGYIAK